MSEIWNLSALCRCCHKDGQFRSLRAPHASGGGVEIYADLLCETFGITVIPPLIEASYSICDECIQLLWTGTLFRRQVLACEGKFTEYCKNEEMSRTDFIKVEMDSTGLDSDNDNKSPLHYGDDEELVLKSEDTKPKFDVSIENIKCEVTAESAEQSTSAEEKPAPEEKKHVASRVKKIGAKQEKKLGVRADKKIGASKEKKRREDNNESTKRNRATADPSLVVTTTTDSGHTLYSCGLCRYVHKNKKSLRAHIKEHQSRAYRCDHCQQQFNIQYLFVQHMRETHNDLPFKCSLCEKKFLSRSYQLHHENTHTNKQKLTCDLCNKQFACKQTLRKHFSWHNGTNKKYVCDKCGHSCNDQTNLNIHIRSVHEKLRPFHCTICQKNFSAKKNLKEHLRNHTGERPYQCDKCLAAFISSTFLRKHQLTHGGTTSPKYTCVVCNSRFEERGAFKRHVRSHTGSLPHKCHICSKDFSCKYSFRRHVDQHSGIKAFECSICRMRFTQKIQMQRHVANIHNPNKIVVKTKCVICKQNVSDIEKHKKSHSVRPFSCHLCNKTYSENNTLTRHIKNIHLEKKSHSCADCGKRYTLKKSLTIHKLKVHGCALKVEGDDSLDAEVTAYAIKNKT